MPFSRMEDYSFIQLLTLGISHESNKLLLGKPGYRKHTQMPDALSSQRATCLMTSSYSSRSRLLMQTSTKTLKISILCTTSPHVLKLTEPESALTAKTKVELNELPGNPGVRCVNVTACNEPF